MLINAFIPNCLPVNCAANDVIKIFVPPNVALPKITSAFPPTGEALLTDT